MTPGVRRPLRRTRRSRSSSSAATSSTAAVTWRAGTASATPTPCSSVPTATWPGDWPPATPTPSRGPSAPRSAASRPSPSDQPKGTITMTITQLRPCPTRDLAALVADLGRASRSTRGSAAETVEAVCEALRPALSAPDLLLPGAAGRRPVGVPVAPVARRARRRLLPGGPGVAAGAGDRDPRPPRRGASSVSTRAPSTRRATGSPATTTWSSRARRSRTRATSPGCCRPVTSTGSTTPVTRPPSRCTSTAPTSRSSGAAASGGPTRPLSFDPVARRCSTRLVCRGRSPHRLPSRARTTSSWSAAGTTA